VTTEASTLTEHLMLERDVEMPTVEVDALGAFLVEDADVMDAESIRTEYTHCFCQDGRHRPEDRGDLTHQRRFYPPVGAHRLKAYIYAVIIEETEDRMTPRDGNRDLRGDEINRIRQDLDKRPDADVKKAERQAKNAAAKDSAIRSGGDEKDRVGLFEKLFGKGK